MSFNDFSQIKKNIYINSRQTLHFTTEKNVLFVVNLPADSSNDKLTLN